MGFVEYIEQQPLPRQELLSNVRGDPDAHTEQKGPQRSVLTMIESWFQDVLPQECTVGDTVRLLKEWESRLGALREYMTTNSRGAPFVVLKNLVRLMIRVHKDNERVIEQITPDDRMEAVDLIPDMTMEKLLTEYVINVHLTIHWLMYSTGSDSFSYTGKKDQ